MLLSMFEDMVEANQAYASQFDLAGIPARAAKGLALVTCMDSRIEPLATLGLVPGDAKILRNAGARVTDDTLRSLALATLYLGVERIAVMQHTGCALAGKSDDELRSGFPEDQRAVADRWAFMAMPDPDHELVRDVEAVRSCELIPSTVVVEGWRYQVETGAIVTVVP